MTLESAVGTTDFADNTDKQGLGFALPCTCEVRAQPRWKHPFQSRPSVESVKSAVKTTAVFRITAPREDFLFCPVPCFPSRGGGSVAKRGNGSRGAAEAAEGKRSRAFPGICAIREICGPTIACRRIAAIDGRQADGT